MTNLHKPALKATRLKRLRNLLKFSVFMGHAMEGDARTRVRFFRKYPHFPFPVGHSRFLYKYPRSPLPFGHTHEVVDLERLYNRYRARVLEEATAAVALHGLVERD